MLCPTGGLRDRGSLVLKLDDLSHCRRELLRGTAGRPRGFDPAAWKGVNTLTNDARLRMVDDRLRRYHFRGMTRAQVTALLGEPPQTGYFKEWDLVCWLGPERGWISIDSEWLAFRLDAEKKVSDYKSVRD